MSSSSHTSVLIIGAGPCGLGAAYRLNELAAMNVNVDWALVDAAATAGGLATSVVDDAGFTWDMGGHVIFSHFAYFTRLLNTLIPPDQWNVKQREAWVWMRDRFIPYPFQQNIHRLPKPDIVRCISGLIDVERRRHTFTKPANFDEWLQQSFGAGICDVFMIPYNKKVWAHNATDMNVEWMGERVATVDTVKILCNVVNNTDEIGWGPNNTFRFPLRGGTGAIWKKLYERLPANRIHFNKTVIAVDATAHRVDFADGSHMTYDHLMSTMPLDRLCCLTTNAALSDTHLKEAATKFKYSSSHIIGFGINGQPPPHLQTKCWMYFPEDTSPFYRATIFSNYSQYNVAKPGEQWSIMCEVAESEHHHVDMNTIIDLTLQGCYNTQLLNTNNIILSRFHRRLEYGYPTPFIGRDSLCQSLFTLFESHHIYSRGRFGAWKYEISNQDHSLMLGIECIDHILLQTEEITFKYPQIVNAQQDNKGRIPFECLQEMKLNGL